MKAVKVKCEIQERKQIKTHLIQFKLFSFLQTRLFTNTFHVRLLSIRVFSADGHYLKNRALLLRNYWPMIARRKFDVLETNSCPRREASRANKLIVSSPRMNTITSRDQFIAYKNRRRLSGELISNDHPLHKVNILQ